MRSYHEFTPVHPLLTPYVESYVHISGPGAIPTKTIHPRMGATVILDFNGSFSGGGARFTRALSGTHRQEYRCQSWAGRTDRVLIRFSPYGLSRFTPVPAYALVNQVLELSDLWGEPAIAWHQQVADVPEFSQRLARIESFLVQRFLPPSPADQLVFRAADYLRHSPGSGSLAKLKNEVPLSFRHLERKFKALLGVDLQTYQRLCRFDYAKTLLLKQPSARLTQIGYQAHYYDQAHFSREFKAFFGTSPKRFTFCD